MSAQGHSSFFVVVTAKNNYSKREHAPRDKGHGFRRKPGALSKRPLPPPRAKDDARSPPAAENMCDLSCTWDAPQRHRD